jgi:secreted PhoX family phosphatase
VVARSQEWSSVTGAIAAAPTAYSGTTVPSSNNPDGTGSFPRPGGGTILVRNSELSGAQTSAGGVPATYLGNPVPTYDPDHRGGTSTLEIDHWNNLIAMTPSLSGTFSNCAGGVTPWATWLTCEETDSYNASRSLAHGYVFEVDPRGDGTTAAPLVGMGRFAHEAVAIDPSTGNAYLTEDASGPLGLFYKFVPDNADGAIGTLAQGGTLYALRATKPVSGSPVVIQNLAEATLPGTVYDVTWVPVPQPNPTGATTASAGPSQRIRNQFADGDITRSKKFEGVWFGHGKVWINCSYAKTAADYTTGTPHEGQVWLYDPAAETLTLKVRLAPGGLFDGPDNIVVARWGEAFLCEDGDGDNYVIGVASDDVPFAFAKNQIFFANEFSEFTGACFSTDQSTMFVNTQRPGITYAITGPWHRRVP